MASVAIINRMSVAALNRSMSWPLANPATEPPSKSDSMCRKIDAVVAKAMRLGSFPAEVVARRVQRVVIRTPRFARLWIDRL